MCVCRKKTTQQFSQRVSTAFQQWEAEAHRTEEQEEKLSVSLLLWFITFDSVMMFELEV